MSAIGIVVVLAKKKKKKRDTSYQDELKQNPSQRSDDDSSPLPVIEERELFSLQCQAGPTTENDFCNLEETHSFEGQQPDQKSFNQAETTQRAVPAPTVQPVLETVPVTAETQAGNNNSWLPSISAALCFLIFSFVSCWSYFNVLPDSWKANDFFGSNTTQNFHASDFGQHSRSNVSVVSATSPLTSDLSTDSSPGWKVSKLDIKKIKVGMRVPALNPLRSGETGAEPASKINPETWRKFTVKVQKENNKGWVVIQTLCPKDWLSGSVDADHFNSKDENRPMKWMEIPELEIKNFGYVINVEPCPPIVDGPGHVVTSTFHHQSAKILDLTFQAAGTNYSQPVTIGSTPNHPFWSEKAGDFVRAEDLEIGDTVRTADKKVLQLSSIAEKDSPEPVFNFEVAGEHVYYVSDSGILVHNNGKGPNCGNGGGSAPDGSAGKGGKEAKNYVSKDAESLVGVSSSEAKSLGNALKRIEIDGKPAIESVEAFGSRAGSTYRGRGPGPNSDLDIFVTVNSNVVNSSTKLQKVIDDVEEISELFGAVKRFEVNPMIEIDKLAASAKQNLEKTPFINLGD